MRYSFSFTEINFGTVEIEADHPPNDGEIIEAIENGNVCFNKTIYENIRHQDSQRNCDRKDRAGDR